MKTVRTVICMLLLLTVAGLTVTLITKGVLEGKRRILYGYDTTVDMSEPTTDGIHNSDDGPGNMIMDRETYLEELASLEKQINEIWANVADVNGNSALSAAKYEKGVWEEELNKILDAYYTAKSVVAVERMQQDEQSFRAEREKLSQDVAKAADEALDGLAYNKEYIRLTKEKTYEYIDRYFTEE